MGIVVTPDGSAVRTSSSPYVTLRESISMVARQIEDLAWINVSTDQTGREVPYEERKQLLARIRLYRRRSPLAKQAANLLQHYTLGKGISLSANNRVKIAPIIDEFWEDPANAQVFTSHQSQKERLDDVFTDGDLFIVLFPDSEQGTLHLGVLDAMFVEDIIPDRDNAKIPRWYKARKPKQSYDFTTNAWLTTSSDDIEYYRDWRNDEDRDAPPEAMIAKGLVYHVRINHRGRFGESELATAIDWLKAHKDFMEDRASLNRAASQIAWKKKRKGGPSEIAQEVSKLQSTLVTNRSRYETNPSNASAATIVENEGTNLEWVKTDTGDASADERILRMMAGSAMGGVPNHYFGDEAQANLATATAMELPLLKTYEDWQTLWGDVVKDILGFLLDTAHKAGRIGDRDDSTRYSERVTTPRAVLATPDVAGPAATVGAAKPPLPALGPGGKPVVEADVAEADVAEAGGMGTEKSFPLTVSLLPKTVPLQSVVSADESTGKLDWFVDVDFPPIIQKDLAAYVGAVKALYEMLPTGNIESQKLVVELMLIILDQNNIDDVMERMFPADAAPADLLTPPGSVPSTDPAALAKALQTLLGSAGAAAASPQAQLGAGAGAGAGPAAVTESIAEYRVRRVLQAARQADDALRAVGT